jgi:hypothetical protein
MILSTESQLNENQQKFPFGIEELPDNQLADDKQRFSQSCYQNIFEK